MLRWREPQPLGDRQKQCVTSEESNMACTFRLGSSLLLALLAFTHLSCRASKEQPEPSDGVSQIVYAVRQHTVVDGSRVEINVAGGMGQVMDYKRFVPGG